MSQRYYLWEMSLRRQGYDSFIPCKIPSGADGGQAVLLATQYQVPIQISAKSMRMSFVLILEGSRPILTFQSQAKKMLNVDSPSFTPSFLSPNGSNAVPVKKPAGISPKAASAAPFMPKAIITRKHISLEFPPRQLIEAPRPFKCHSTPSRHQNP